MMRVSALIITLALCSCYSTYMVTHTETSPDGTVYHTEIREMIAPGGKKISEGKADIGARSNSDEWHIRLGETGQADATRTAQMYERLTELFGAAAITALDYYLKSQAIPIQIPTPNPSPINGVE